MTQEDRKYNILVYGIEKRGLKEPSQEISNHNFKLFFDREDVFYYQNLAELNHVRNAIILIDEAQVLIDSRDWENLPREFKYKVAQHRKPEN